MADENTENIDWKRLRGAIALGKDLAHKHPEIADYHKAGMNYSQIVDMLKYEKVFEEKEHSRSFLETAVEFSIKGNEDEELGIDYVGLMTEKELKAIRNNGIVPWDSYEYEHALRLERDNYGPGVIAQMLNISHHFGKSVRKGSDVKKKLNH